MKTTKIQAMMLERIKLIEEQQENILEMLTPESCPDCEDDTLDSWEFGVHQLRLERFFKEGIVLEMLNKKEDVWETIEELPLENFYLKERLVELLAEDRK